MSVKAAINSSNGNVDITQYLAVEKGTGMEPGDPTFTEKIFARSLLKAGATLALEHLREKELVFPLILSLPIERLANPILNPSFAYDGQGSTTAAEWTTGPIVGINPGATLTVHDIPGYAQAASIFGLESYCEVHTAGTLANEGISTGNTIPCVSGVPITIYLSIFEEIAGQKIQLFLGNAKTFSQIAITQTNNGWTRHSITLTPSETGFIKFCVRSVGTEKINILFTAVSEKEPYKDGDSAGWKWNGPAGRSESENKHGKTGLANLIQEINTIIHTPGAKVEWQDEGATQPTYYDLISGQFDDEFDYRLSEKNALRGKLRLFTQPLGYVSKNGPRALMVQGVATTVQVGTAPIITFQASGVLDGDAPAVIQAQGIASTAAVEGRPDFYTAISVLPSASYIPYIPAASSAIVLMTFFSEASAPGGTYAHFSNPHSAITVERGGYQQTKFNYAGEHRVLMAARTPSLAIVTPCRLYKYNTGFVNNTVATPLATSGWHLYDLGVITTASSALAAGESFFLALSVGIENVASAAIDFAGLIILPEQSTCWLTTLSGIPAQSKRMNGYTTFDGQAQAIRLGGYIGVPASGISASIANVEGPFSPDVTGYSRGAIPQIQAAASPPVLAMLWAEPNGSMSNGVKLSINVLERTRYVF